jgi:Cytochrome C oxidase, cbb3-type, subunit III
MGKIPDHRHKRAALGCLVVLLALPMPPARLAADDYAYARRLYLDKAQCAFCHGWAADGAGEPQSNGGAANLRESKLGRDLLIEVIRCGVPGKAMPHFDELAYTDKRCYGLSEADLGANVPQLPPASTLQRREIEALADYLMAKIIGRGKVTREECEEVFPGRRSCADYPAKP